MDGLVINKGKPNYIYMPTWQGSDVNDAKDNSNYLISLIDQINESDNHFNFLIKVHPFLYKELKDNEQLKSYLISNKYDSNEIFKVTDLLITDYSSVLFDFLVTKKPIVFFNWDSDIYKNDRGSYIKDSELPGPNIKNVEELKKVLYDVSKIEGQYGRLYEKFIKEFVPNENETMVEEYIEAIFNKNFSNIKCIKPTHGKRKILFHAGALMDNGITSSFLNLVNQIDYSKYDVTVFLHDSKLKEIRDNWAKLHPAARKMFKPGLPVYTIEENILDRMLKNSPLEFDIKKYFPKEAYYRESKRLFGNSTFDAVVDFSGYSYFWAKYLVVMDAEVKICYMHNDLYAETNRKVGGKYPLRNDLLGIFSLYSKFDYLASVSEALNEVNKEKLNDYVRPEQMIYINNSINIDRVINGENSNKNLDFAISKMHQRLLLKSDKEELNFKQTLEQGISDTFTLTLNSSQLITKVAEIDDRGEKYVYVLVNNLPIGWTKLSNFGNFAEDFEVVYQLVGSKGYFIKESAYLFKSIEDRIFDNSTKILLKKYDQVDIEAVVKILGSEYYKIKFEGDVFFTNAKNIQIMEITNAEVKQQYLYAPLVTKTFSKFAKIKKLETKKGYEIYKTPGSKKSQIYELPQNIFYTIKGIEFKHKEYFAKIGDGKRTIGWIAVDNIEFLSNFLDKKLNDECNQLAVDEPISVKSDIEKIEVFTNIEASNKIKFGRNEIINFEYVGKRYSRLGKLYEFILDKQSLFISSQSPYVYHWLFKNYEIVKDVHIIIDDEKVLLSSQESIFLLRQRYVNGRAFYEAIIDEKYTIFESNPEFKENLIDLEEQPLIIDEKDYDAFVCFKNKRDILWSQPYDRNVDNEKLATTTLLSDRVFRTKKVSTLYHGLRYVSLYLENQFVGWINETLINICPYQQYTTEDNTLLPIGSALSFFEKVAPENFVFEEQGIVYQASNIIKKVGDLSYKGDDIEFVDGTLELSNGEKWIRIRNNKKILGWIAGELKNQLEINNSSTINVNQKDFYITEKDFSGILVPKVADIKIYYTQEDILSRNYEIVNFTEICAFKITSYQSGKYYYVENSEISGFVLESDVEVAESQYMDELPQNVKELITPTDTIFVTMGRLSPEKNQVELLKATKELVKKYPNLKVLVLGKGPLEETLKKSIAQLNMQDNFFLVGQFAYPFTIIRQADFFVFPSIWEGQPMVLLETLLMEKKIISSNLKQSVHVLKEGKLGLIADGADYIAISKGMDDMISEKHSYFAFDGYEYNNDALGQFYNYINKKV